MKTRSSHWLWCLGLATAFQWANMELFGSVGTVSVDNVVLGLSTNRTTTARLRITTKKIVSKGAISDSYDVRLNPTGYYAVFTNQLGLTSVAASDGKLQWHVSGGVLAVLADPHPRLMDWTLETALQCINHDLILSLLNHGTPTIVASDGEVIKMRIRLPASFTNNMIAFCEAHFARAPSIVPTYFKCTFRSPAARQHLSVSLSEYVATPTGILAPRRIELDTNVRMEFGFSGKREIEVEYLNPADEVPQSTLMIPRPGSRDAIHGQPINYSAAVTITNLIVATHRVQRNGKFVSADPAEAMLTLDIQRPISRGEHLLLQTLAAAAVFSLSITMIFWIRQRIKERTPFQVAARFHK